MSINCWFGLKNPVKKFNPFSLYQSQILGKPIKQWFFFVKSSWSNLQPQKKQMFHGFPVISPSFPHHFPWPCASKSLRLVRRSRKDHPPESAPPESGPRFWWNAMLGGGAF
jgi:hypothetical protein